MASSKSKQDDFIRTALRVPPDLHAKIHSAASAAGRTFNAEIIHCLRLALDGKISPRRPVDIQESANEMLKMIERMEAQRKAVERASADLHNLVRTLEKSGVTFKAR